MIDRAQAQLAFLAECDKLKSVDRANLLAHDTPRAENSAEHSWHVALWALIFAPTAPDGCDIDRAIHMLILHDLVEIDAGDMPIHLSHDANAHAKAEQDAADRIFGLLPSPQSAQMRALWDEFETAQTPTARFAKRMDHAHPAFQTLLGQHAPDWHRDVITENFTSGRAARLKTEWPECHRAVTTLLQGGPLPDGDFAARIRFLNDCDKLKLVERQTTLLDGSRRENSGEHSWHVALFALILGEHAPDGADPAKAVRMMLIHDVVEIYAGDSPLHVPSAQTDQAAREAKAADYLFGMLPPDQGAMLRALWNEFEAKQTPTARFAKAMDRAQPPQSNLATGGDNWRKFGVARDQIEARVATPIRDGAPAIWQALRPAIDDWFAQNAPQNGANSE